MVRILVLGTGCPKCEKLAENVRRAVETAGIADAEIEKVTDIMQIMKYGVMLTPALVVNGEVKIMGRVPDVDEIAGLLSGR